MIESPHSIGLVGWMAMLGEFIALVGFSSLSRYRNKVDFGFEFSIAILLNSLKNSLLVCNVIVTAFYSIYL